MSHFPTSDTGMPREMLTKELRATQTRIIDLGLQKIFTSLIWTLGYTTYEK